jgi:hypothetical protein
MLELDELIHSVSVEWGDEGVQNYSTLCGRWGSECFENKFLDLGGVMERIENGSLRASYPIMLNPETFESHVMAIHLGGVRLTNDSYSIDHAEAAALNYFIAVDSPEDDEMY